jgi:hypothetical protein
VQSPVALALVARMVIADNAKRFGVDWKGSARKWSKRLPELQDNLASLIAKKNVYPKYYLQVCAIPLPFLNPKS